MSLIRLFSFVLSLLAGINYAAADSIITGSKPYTFVPGTIISSSQVNAEFDYVINQVNTNAAKNGVNSSITALLGLTTPIVPNSGGSQTFVGTTIGGTANAITVTATRPDIATFTYTQGYIVELTIISTNTGATTINVNSLGTKNIFKQTSAGAVALTGGELVSGQAIVLYYDGTQFQFINSYELFGTKVSIASATTTDIGTTGSHNISITGTATISSFGSSANVNSPIYLVSFTGASRLTYNATSLIIPRSSDRAVSAGDYALLEYLGSGNWRVASYFTKEEAQSVGQANGLTIRNNTGTPNTQIDISITGKLILEQVNTGATVGHSGYSATINAATTGANALDTGSLAASTWYYIYAISDGTGSNRAYLLSLSSTTPTMPTGYTFKYRIGSIFTNGSSNFTRIIQKGNIAKYEVIAGSTTPNLPIMISGNSGAPATPTWTAVAVTSFVPSATATRILGGLGNGVTNSGATMAAPNNSYGAFSSTTNPPPAVVNIDAASANAISTINFNFVLESTNIYYASNKTNGYMFCSGWIDTVNAN